MADSYNELFGLGSHSEDAALEGWWPLMDNAASTAVDDVSSNNINGTLQGGNNTADLDEAGPNTWLTSALHLDGTADYVSTSFNPNGLAALSILLRAKSDTLVANQGTFGCIDATPDNWQQFYDANDLRSRLDAGGGSTIVNGSTLTITSWFTSALFYDGANLTPYFNGSAVTPGALTGNIDVDAVVFLGARNNAGTPDLRWDGHLSEYAIFSRAITSGEEAQWRLGPEPINSVAPAVSGTETEGETLSVTNGTWGLDAPFSSGTNGTITYSYQWTRSDDASGTGEADIGSATSATYLLDAADVGKFIRCRIRATNDGGFDADADTNSDFTGAIAAAGGGVGRFDLLHGLTQAPTLRGCAA